MRKFLYINLLVAAIYCSGCSSSYRLTIDSTPQNATLYCSGWAPKKTPAKLYYNKDDLDSYIVLPDCYVQLPCGAKAEVPRNMTVYERGGTIYTAERPSSYPNAELDYQNDYRQKQLQLQQEQLQLQQEQLNEMRRTKYQSTDCRRDFLGNVHCETSRW